MSNRCGFYVVDEQEYFAANTSGNLYERYDTVRQFQFLDNLMSFLDLDAQKVKAPTERIEQAFRNLCVKRSALYAKQIMTELESLSDLHIMFECAKLQWEDQLAEAELYDFANAEENLPRNIWANFSAAMAAIQGQVNSLLEWTLDVKSEKTPVREKLAEYYEGEGPDPVKFAFIPLTTKYESVPIADGKKVFAEVIQPRDMYDIIAFSMRKAMEREQPVRQCKHCGRYFAVTGRSNTEYCNRVVDEKGRTCKEVGAINVWKKNREKDSPENKVIEVYRREYKKRFARMRAGRLAQSAFYSWSGSARDMKKKCLNDEMTLEEFTEWLENS